MKTVIIAILICLLYLDEALFDSRVSVILTSK
jgi:hypothetical protein